MAEMRSDIEQNAVRRIRRALGGTFHEGGTTWAARAAAMLALLNLGNGRGGMALQICPSDDTRGLRRALGGAWYYTVTRGGSVVRDLLRNRIIRGKTSATRSVTSPVAWRRHATATRGRRKRFGTPSMDALTPGPASRERAAHKEAHKEGT